MIRRGNLLKLQYYSRIMLCTSAVGVASKTSTLSVLRETYDETKHLPGTAAFRKFKLNETVCAGIKALHDYKTGLGNASPKLFAETDGEFHFPEKALPGNVKAAFDCTNKDMPLFPFAATAQVSLRGKQHAPVRLRSA